MHPQGKAKERTGDFMRMERGIVTLAVVALVAAGCGPGPAAQPDLAVLIDCAAHPELSPKECGYCLGDSWCQANDAPHPRCEPNTHKCVACLPASPSSPDTCPQGQVCQLSHGSFACSMSCAVNAECLKLMGDGFYCCGGGCVKLDSDVNHCGGCGQSCSVPNNGVPGCNDGHCIVGGCNAGFADCNMLPADGCEVAVGTDPLNCGTCGKACQPAPNSIAMCANGACSSSCAPGYAHCSQNQADGCEIDTTFDVNNCGACGKQCTAPANATTACDAAKCSFRCKPGYADCNGDPKDGCEVAVLGDTNNCGHCGNVCPVRPQAQSATCADGLCGNSCNNGWGDCDGNVNNGCESNLQIDLNNCGGCGMPCVDPHGKSTCSQAVCSRICDKGYTLCNGAGPKGTDKCVNLKDDDANCGMCGNACPQGLPYCTNSVCGRVPHPTAFTGVFTSFQDSPQQCSDWKAFQAALDRQGYNSITISGSNDKVGVTCTGVSADQLCQALHSNTSVSVNCNGQTWATGNCGFGLELTADSNVCFCNFGFGHTVRPCIGNLNWGGVGSSTCFAPNQTMTVTCAF